MGAQTRGEGANLPTAMVQFCAIISASFHVRAHFWVPHLNFLALLRVGLSKDTLPGPKGSQSRGTQRLFTLKYFFRRSKYWQEFYYLRTAKQFKMTFPFIENFRSLCNKFPTIFWSLIFHISLPRLGCFSYKKEKWPDIFGLKSVMEIERKNKNSHFRT